MVCAGLCGFGRALAASSAKVIRLDSAGAGAAYPSVRLKLRGARGSRPDASIRQEDAFLTEAQEWNPY